MTRHKIAAIVPDMDTLPIATTTQEHVSTRIAVLLHIKRQAKTSSEVARALDMDRALFSRKLRLAGPTWKPDEIVHLADFFGVSIDWLVGRMPFDPIVLDERELTTPDGSRGTHTATIGELLAEIASLINDDDAGLPGTDEGTQAHLTDEDVARPSTAG